jgi:ferritin-like metal-binding protein YciE
MPGLMTTQHEESAMPVRTPKELFVRMLSDARHHAERATKIYEELGQVAQDPAIQEALQSRAFIQDKTIKSLDRCFELIGEKPITTNGRLQDVFLEDFRRELAEIQTPAAKALFLLIKANHLMHLRIAEYVALVAMADVSGHFGVGVLLESCLADKVAFTERTRRLIRRTIESKHAVKLAA